MISYRTVDLARLNSATKYPSIDTYHRLDPKTGDLTEALNHSFTGDVYMTEKIDGTNGRIVLCPDGWIIGSRNELLTGEGDLIVNPKESIVETLMYSAERLSHRNADENVIVAYFEVYGSQGPKAKQYSHKGKTNGCRLFDIATIPTEVLDWEPSKISGWRQNSGQDFVPAHLLPSWADAMGADLVPWVGGIDGSQLPTGVDETEAWMQDLVPLTQANLDRATPGAAEGLVIRSENRSAIAKLRFEDYGRTRVRSRK